jgi:hypothetical protein
MRWTFRCFHLALFAAAVTLSASAAPSRANVLGDVWDFVTGGNAPDLAADHPGMCDDYADTAVFNDKQRAENSCPLGGDRYSGNRSGHYWWCMGQTVGDANAEKSARQGEVDACMGSSARCRDYAQKAVQAARDNYRFHCGNGGPRWTDNESGHYAWCQSEAIAGTLTTVNFEESARTGSINSCKARYDSTAIEACEGYATRADENAKTFRDLQCDPEQSRTSGRWFRGADFHFAWCILAANARFRDGEDNARIAGVKECKDRGGGEKKLTPIPSTGPSPFGGAKALQSNQGLPDQKLLKKDATRVRKVLPNASTGGFNTVKQGEAVQPGLNMGGSAAMDRLSGDNQTPSSTPGVKFRNSNRPLSGRSPANAGVATTPKVLGTTALPMPRSESTIDYGGCAGCGKGTFTPPR